MNRNHITLLTLLEALIAYTTLAPMQPPTRITLPTQALATLSLLYAAEHNHIQLIHALISEHGITIDAQDPLTGKTALHLVAGKNYPLTVRALLELRASMNAQDTGGNTVFHDVVHHNNHQIIPILLQEERGRPGHSKETCCLNTPNYAGHTPLNKLLRDHVVKQKDFDREVFQSFIAHNEVDVNKPDIQGLTPLHHACQIKNPGFVAALISAHAQNPETGLALATQLGNTQVQQFLEGYLGKKSALVLPKQTAPTPSSNRYGNIPPQ